MIIMIYQVTACPQILVLIIQSDWRVIYSCRPSKLGKRIQIYILAGQVVDLNISCFWGGRYWTQLKLINFVSP